MTPKEICGIMVKRIRQNKFDFKKLKTKNKIVINETLETINKNSVVKGQLGHNTKYMMGLSPI